MVNNDAQLQHTKKTEEEESEKPESWASVAREEAKEPVLGRFLWREEERLQRRR